MCAWCLSVHQSCEHSLFSGSLSGVLSTENFAGLVKGQVLSLEGSRIGGVECVRAPGAGERAHPCHPKGLSPCAHPQEELAGEGCV